MPRTRSEYLCVDLSSAVAGTADVDGVRIATDEDRDAVARLLLDAYRGTVDDEGEDMPEAIEAADECLARRIVDSSVAIEEDGVLVAISFVVEFEGRVYIDPVATMAARKRQGLGRRAVRASLRRVLQEDVPEIGATITDGNIASEQLFASLGFTRVGAW